MPHRDAYVKLFESTNFQKIKEVKQTLESLGIDCVVEKDSVQRISPPIFEQKPSGYSLYVPEAVKTRARTILQRLTS